MLFALPETARRAVIAEPIGGEPVETTGQRVRLLRVGGRWLARPLSGPTSGSRALAWADGIARPDPDQPGRAGAGVLGEPSRPPRSGGRVGRVPPGPPPPTAPRQRGGGPLWTAGGGRAALAG